MDYRPDYMSNHSKFLIEDLLESLPSGVGAGDSLSRLSECLSAASGWKA
jgi:hypothetical protein